MNDHRWGFEEAEDWEYEETQARPDESNSDTEIISGQDPDSVVTVNVSPRADVVSVTLAPDWKRAVDPRGLHTSVLAAANAATMQALAWQVEDIERNPPPMPRFGAGQADSADESPLSTEDMLRLTNEVAVELERFSQQASAFIDRQISAESAGGHVQGSAKNGQVLEVSIDANWAAAARNPEIESELVEVLRALHDRSTPGELANGPQGSAIAEIMGLLYDPERLARRAGLLPPSAAAGGNDEGK